MNISDELEAFPNSGGLELSGVIEGLRKGLD